MSKVLTVVGARPQFIKAAVVSRALAARGLGEFIVHTGQHFDANMSDVFFGELEIPPPARNLGVGGGGHGQNTGRMLEAVEHVLVAEQPDCVLVYGDTDSTLAGALAAAKLHIPVAHVEAGLRSYNRQMPEEINRVLTDHVSSILFAPSELAVKNLADEGIRGDQVELVGDVMYDAALFYGAKAEQESDILRQVGITSKGYMLATVHRAENTDDRVRLEAILNGLGRADEMVVLPLHPRTKSRLMTFGLSIPDNFNVIDPVGYLDMVMLEKNATLIATDSGGVQKEAFFHRVPCVTLRDETEWAELVDSGWNRLASPSKEQAIVDAIESARACHGVDVRPYGSGAAAGRIADTLHGQTTQ